MGLKMEIKNNIPKLQKTKTFTTSEKIDKNSNKPQKTKVQFEHWQEGNSKKFILKGQHARTLAALINKHENGITALELSSWAFRLAAYIFTLRTKYKLNIVTKTEPHVNSAGEYGSHARYFLISKVRKLKDF
jgi:hypothetical protein